MYCFKKYCFILKTITYLNKKNINLFKNKNILILFIIIIKKKIKEN